MRFGFMIASLSLLFSFTSNAGVFGINPVKKIIQENKSKRIKSDDSSTQNCANFTGTWKGVCKDNEGLNEESEWNIVQHKCETITFEDNENFNFGGVETVVDTTKKDSSTVTKQIDFGKDGNSVTMIWNAQGRSLEINSFWQIFGKATLILESDSKLVTQADFENKVNIDAKEVRHWNYKNVCELTKIK